MMDLSTRTPGVGPLESLMLPSNSKLMQTSHLPQPTPPCHVPPRPLSACGQKLEMSGRSKLSMKASAWREARPRQRPPPRRHQLSPIRQSHGSSSNNMESSCHPRTVITCPHSSTCWQVMPGQQRSLGLTPSSFPYHMPPSWPTSQAQRHDAVSPLTDSVKAAYVPTIRLGM